MNRIQAAEDNRGGGVQWLLRTKIGVLFLSAILMVVMAGTSHAKDILITNDTGTQGKRNGLFEINSEIEFDRETIEGVSTKERGIGIESIFSYGITETADIILAIPYAWSRVEEEGAFVQKENGLTDLSLEFKWRFHEKDDLSFALKAGISLPVGDEEKGFGSGKATYSLFFITTKEIMPAKYHLNLAYIRNNNTVGERKDLWYASLAGEASVTENLSLIGNIGIQSNSDPASATPPAFILGGVSYSVTKTFDLNFGIKAGLNRPETDYALLAGLAWRF